jgi:signal peptidase I
MNDITTEPISYLQPPVESGKKDRASYLSAAFMAFAALLFFVLGLVWLGLVFVFVLLALLAYKWAKKRFWPSPWFKALRYAVVFAAIFVVAIFIRLFVFEVFEIPSESMENTLLPGDKIVVNKLVIGPQTPKSPFDIPWVNLLFYMNKQARAHIDSTWWEPIRLNGWSKIKHNDVLVFKNEPLAPDYFIKRCVALPGDELQIINGELFINGQAAFTNSLPHIKNQWVLYINNPEGFNSLADSLQVNAYYYHQNGTGAGKELTLTNKEAAILGHSACIDSMHMLVQQANANAWLSPYGKRAFWSLDNYGPIKIPYKGWQIVLNDEAVTLYYETMHNWENKTIETVDGRFFIGGKQVTSYTFEYNYYVFMGDHRHNSIDSRMWGFLPEQKIVGKASNILWSNNREGMRWERIMKKIK